MNILDFIKGVDFTVLTDATGADHNNLIELAVPSDDRGLIVVSKDNLGFPIVPDANAITKFKNYLWIRIPDLSADKTPIIYVWNDDLPSLPVQLKWVSPRVDLTTINASIAAATATANNALTTANTAIATANAANTASAAALIDATNANTLADDALATSGVAYTTAQNALNAANQALNRNTAYVKLSETTNKGVNGGLISNVTNALTIAVRILNTVDSNAGGLVTLNTVTGVITVVTAGIYEIRCTAPAYTNASAGEQLAHQLLLVKDSDNTTLLTGTTMTSATVPSQTVSEVVGKLTLNVGDTLRFDHYTKSAGSNSNVIRGLAANIHPDAGGKEVYSVCELIKLN